jgi:hypothetical protein
MTDMVYRFSEEMEEMVRNGVSEDSEEFQRVKAQWAYACELRDYYESTPPAPAATPRPPDGPR